MSVSTASANIEAEARARAYHEVRFSYDPKRAAVWRALCRYLQRFVGPGGSLLELGAGYGEFSRFIEAAEKHALELNPDMASHWPSNVQPHIQSALDPLPLESESLNTVFASNFFEHFTIEDGERIVAEARRVLKPGGRLICVQPNFRLEPRRYFDDYTHKQIYTDVSFCDFLEANGLKVTHCEPRFTPFSMKSRLPTASWLVSLYLALPYRPLAGQFLVVAERR
jgi:ubiquinone/menaquinone biosynthesis C-methylase UbiE